MGWHATPPPPLSTLHHPLSTPRHPSAPSTAPHHPPLARRVAQVVVWFADTAAELGGEELRRAVDAMLPAGFLSGVSDDDRTE
eukprot:7217825-Prymnesium_polylepis.1